MLDTITKLDMKWTSLTGHSWPVVGAVSYKSSWVSKLAVISYYVYLYSPFPIVEWVGKIFDTRIRWSLQKLRRRKEKQIKKWIKELSLPPNLWPSPFKPSREFSFLVDRWFLYFLGANFFRLEITEIFPKILRNLFFKQQNIDRERKVKLFLLDWLYKGELLRYKETEIWCTGYNR